MKIPWRGLQVNEESCEGFVALQTERGERLRPVATSDDGGVISFAVPTRGLTEGEELTAILGGLSGTVAPRWSQPNRFFILVAAPKESSLEVPALHGDALDNVVAACVMDVIGGPMVSLRVYAPSTTCPGSDISLLVRPEDAHRNVASEQPGLLTVRLNGDRMPVERVSIPGTTCCKLTGVILPSEGVYRLEVLDTAAGIKAVTNPIWCRSKSSESILWGSMHGHTELSDGTGSAHSYFAGMRDECAIDFGALADHDHAGETPDEFWEITQATVKDFNQPGVFTTFLGYEWARWRRLGHGDRNVYYLDDGLPMFRSDDDGCPAPDDLFRALRDERALVIPHHPAHPGNHNDWSCHDPEKERLVEIYSLWGCSERSAADGNIWPGRPVDETRPDSGMNQLGFVQKALELGWKLGFTANGDDHFGHPADLTTRFRGQTGGITAVYAHGNAREAIWEAFWNRRCYATTGERIVVDFRLNGHPMGSELNLADHPGLAQERRLSVTVYGTSAIKSVEIVRNNKDLYTVAPETDDLCFEWTDTEALCEVSLPANKHSRVPFTFYYVRVTQTNNQMAWASPIWISLQETALGWS